VLVVRAAAADSAWADLEKTLRDSLATFTGDVHLINGDTEMRCKVLVVFYDDDTKDPKAAQTQTMKAADPGPSGERQIKRIEAKGGVTVVQKDQNAVGESATFNMRENTVTLIGNVIVTRGADVLRGQRLAVFPEHRGGNGNVAAVTLLVRPGVAGLARRLDALQYLLRIGECQRRQGPQL